MKFAELAFNNSLVMFLKDLRIFFARDTFINDVNVQREQELD